jgi:hypothetical protein
MVWGRCLKFDMTHGIFVDFLWWYIPGIYHFFVKLVTLLLSPQAFVNTLSDFEWLMKHTLRGICTFIDIFCHVKPNY